METTQASLSSRELISLQSSLKKLAERLMDTYDTLNSALKNLSEDWQDDKFEEFSNEFKSSKEEIREISEKYAAWANDYLQKRIEKAQEYESMTVGRK